MLSQSRKETVLQLFSQGVDFNQIRNETNIAIEGISSILKHSLGTIFVNALDLLKFSEFYYLEKSFVHFFNDLYERIPTSYSIRRNYCRFFPPCLYLFFKLNGI